MSARSSDSTRNCAADLTSPLEEAASFFGPDPARRRAEAEEMKARFGEASLAYADALVRLGTAHLVHASPPAAALDPMREALAIYRAEAPHDRRTGDAHLKIAALLRRLRRYGEAAGQLREALSILARADADANSRAVWERELDELLTLERETARRRLPPA